MPKTLAWLVDLRGRVSRPQYVYWGLGLLIGKVVLDVLWCALLLDRDWSPQLYFTPLPWGLLRSETPIGWLWFACSALPFCWIGVAMSARRLRDAGANPALAALFVAPYANWLLIAVLAVIPPRSEPRTRPREHGRTEPAPVPGLLARGFGGALLASLTTALLVWIGVGVLHFYGGVLFFASPLLQGLLVGVLVQRASFGAVMGQFFVSVGFSVLLLLGFGVEGVVCILMAAPLWIIMGWLGVVLGRAATFDSRWRTVPVWLVVPTLMAVEPLVEPPPAVFEVRTELLVKALPERVWQSLVTFGDMRVPDDLPFRFGVAYPVRATIEGHGPGAVRHCSFNTGDFVEPIEVWDEPRLLRFSVTDCPPAMTEWNPFHEHVHAAHLHGYFVAQQGQFELLAQADGSTLLRGTTWYAHGLRPETYWSWWSDYIVHKIHRRVLEHIRELAER